MNNAETKDKTTDTAAAVAAQGAHVAPEKAPAKKGASQKKDAPKAKKSAKGAKPAEGGKATATPKKQAKAGKTAKASKKAAGKQAAKSAAKPARAKDATTPRPESKGAKILGLIGRAKGATLAEIMKAVEWQAHSVRGWISTAAKKHGVEIESSKNEAGDRVYRIAK
jgi:hypothetical protein